MRQLYLDLKQKDFAGVLCEECGMRYDRSFPEEVKLHAKFHASKNKRYWRCKAKYYSLSLKLEQTRITIEKVKHGYETLKKNLKELLDWISHQSIPIHADEQEVYLLITEERQVIGCLTITKKENEAFLHSKRESVTCKAAIQLIWIQESYRGKKLAQALLKAACLAENLLPSQFSFPIHESITNLAKRFLNSPDGEAYITTTNST